MLLSTKVLRVKPIRVMDRSPWLFLRNLKLGGVLLLSSALLVGCGSNPNGSVADSNANLSSSLTLEAASTVPVLDGKVTLAGVYIHNNTGSAISGIKYGVVNTGSSSSSSQIAINNLTDCATIAANSSCLISFTTPSLTLGQSGSTLIDASYKGSHSKQLINYSYYVSNDYSGVNFSDGSASLYGTNDYATVYAFVGKSQAQNNVGFSAGNSSLGVASGLTNGKVDISANQVVPLELKSNQNVTSNLVTLTPYTVTSSKQLARSLQSATLNNQILQVSIAPTQQANLLMSDSPILNVSAESTATITIINNGNKPATNVALVPADSAKLSVSTASSNPCTNGNSLAVGASCNYQVSLVDKYNNGSSDLNLNYNNSVTSTTATQTVYYYNNQAAPMVSVVPTNSNFTEKINESDTALFNVHNLGEAPLNNLSIVLGKTLTQATLSQTNTCSTSLAANGSCQITVKVTANASIDSGKFYVSLKGNFTNAGTTTSYSFVSKPVYTTITDSTVATITSTTPQATTNINTATSIVLNFSKSMNPTTLNTNNIRLQRTSDGSFVPLSFLSVTPDNQTVTFNQSSGVLAEMVQYRVLINQTAILDNNGNAMGSDANAVAVIFTTGDYTNPTATAVPLGGGQSQFPAITVTFSEAMNLSNLTPANIMLKTNGVVVSGTTITPGTVGNSSIATINLNGTPLDSETTYQVILNQPNLTDVSGRSMGSDSNYVITTFTTADFIAPTLVTSSTIPANGSGSIAIATPISLTFSEAMDTSTLNSTSIKLQNNTDSSFVTLGSPSFSNGNQTVTFQPTANLDTGASYSIVIIPGSIQDANNNPMLGGGSQVVSTFTVASPPPVLDSTVPATGNNSVAANTIISLTFDKTMNTATLNTTNIMLQRSDNSSNITLGSSSFSNGNKTVTFQPAANLSAGVSYKIVIKPNQIQDVNNVPMSASASQIVSNFTVLQSTTDINFIGYSDNGSLYKSVDGITWTPLTNGSNIVFNYYSSINYINAKWMMAGVTNDCGGVNSYCTSSFAVFDGSTWQNSTLYSDGSHINQFSPYGGIAQGNGQTVVNGTYETTDLDTLISIFGSANLNTWSQVYRATTGGSGVTGIAFGDNAFVEVNYGGPANVLRSTDGVTFSPVSISSIYSSPYLGTVIYANNQFVIVGGISSSTTTGKPLILTSSDGLTWTNRSQTALAAGSSLSDITYGNNTYVAVGFYQNTSTGNITKGLILTSSDSITWTQRNESNMTNMSLFGVAYSSGKWIAFGKNGSATVNLTSSDNGVTWESGQTNILISYAAGNHKEIASPVKYIRATPDSYTGSIGGIAGGDAICVNNFGAGYKALLADGTNRYACNNASCTSSLNWVLHAGVSYINASGQQLFTANSKGIFIGNMSNLIPVGSTGSGGGVNLIYPNTGLNSDWTTNSANCSGWSSTVGLVTYGNLSQLGKWYSDKSDGSCSEIVPILCVQQ